MSDLIRVAELCEKATGPDRALDVAIVYALHPDIGQYQPHCRGEESIFWNDPYRKQLCPKFTASIDAAMTLVPEGWWLTLDRYIVSDQPEPNSRTWRVWLKTLVGDLEGDGPCARVEKFAPGATPALALCAAALRVRAYTPPSQQLGGR